MLKFLYSVPTHNPFSVILLGLGILMLFRLGEPGAMSMSTIVSSLSGLSVIVIALSDLLPKRQTGIACGFRITGILAALSAVLVFVVTYIR
jgi:hypothetical protein